MRPIKFRAWDAPGKRWMDEASVYALVKELGIMGHDYGSRYSVEQFTGLHDKNGKEIYEGDIVRVNSVKDPVVVSWDEDSGCGAADKYAGFFIDSFEFGCEVVGNIHENPELLK